jgi:hypothetical protein
MEKEISRQFEQKNSLFLNKFQLKADCGNCNIAKLEKESVKWILH